MTIEVTYVIKVRMQDDMLWAVDVVSIDERP